MKCQETGNAFDIVISLTDVNRYFNIAYEMTNNTMKHLEKLYGFNPQKTQRKYH